MNKIKLIITFVLAIVLFASTSSVNAATVTVGNAPNNTFTISRSLTNVGSSVSNTFTYTITADSSNPAGATGVPTSSTVVFNNETPTSGTATKTGTIDLSGATFSKNGDYKYVVRETSSSNAANYPVDSDNFYTIHVSIRNTSESDFSGKTVTITCTNKTETKLNDAILPFTSGGSLTSISITNTLEGNMADVDRYFKVKVIINGTSGDTYTIGGQTKTGASTTYTVGQDNYIYLKHGETITIGKNGSTNEIPKNLTYSFEEVEADNYDTYINGSTTKGKTSPSLTTGQTDTNTLRNVYETETITGIAMKIIPYVLIIVIVALAIVYLIYKKNKEKKEAL